MIQAPISLLNLTNGQSRTIALTLVNIIYSPMYVQLINKFIKKTIRILPKRKKITFLFKSIINSLCYEIVIIKVYNACHKCFQITLF